MSPEEREALKAELRAELLAELRPAPTVRVERAEPLPAVGATEQIAMRNLQMPPDARQRCVEAFPEELAKAVREDRFAQAQPPTSVIPQAEGGSPRLPARGYVRPLKSGYQG